MSILLTQAFGVSSADATKVPAFDFGTLGTTGGQFVGPRGIAVNHTGNGGVPVGTIYVADSGNRRIQSFDADGNFIRTWGWDVETGGATGFEICVTAAACKAGSNGSAAGQFVLTSAIGGIAVDQTTGNVSVVDRASNRIQQFDATGNFLRTWGKDVETGGGAGFEICSTPANCKAGVAGSAAGELRISSTSAIVGIGTDSSGNLYVADAGNARVQKFGSTGNFLAMGGWDVNSANSSLEYEVCTNALDCKTGVGGTGSGQFGTSNLPSFLAVSPAGDVYVVARGDGALNGTIYHLHSDLSFDPAFAPSTVPSSANNRNAVAFDSGSGHLFFAKGGTDPNIYELDPVTQSVVDTHPAGAKEWVGLGINPLSGRMYGATVTSSAFVRVFDVASLLVTIDGDGSGAVECKVGGGPSEPCQVQYPAGTEVELIPVPGANSAFAGFSGACSGTGSCVLTADDESPESVTATFNLIKHQLDVTKGGTGTGTVISAPAGINCNVPCAGQSIGFTQGTEVTLSATAAAGTKPKVSWEGCASNPTVNQCKVTMDTAKNVSVTFELAMAPLAATGGTAPGLVPHLTDLQGTVDPEGVPLENCRFEYGITTEYGNSVSCIQEIASFGEGSDPIAVSAETEPLEPGTTYHYRLIASNTGGLGAGQDLTFTSEDTSISDECPNAGIRAGQGIGVVLMPDCMALEQASPPFKNNQSARIYVPTPFGPLDPGGFSSNGARLNFASQDALADTPVLRNAFGDPYVATRNAEGQRWVTEAVNPRAESEDIRGGENPVTYSADFSVWSHVNKVNFDQGIARIFTGGLGFGGEVKPLSPPLVPFNTDVPILGSNTPIVEGASTDHSHVYASPNSQPAFYSHGDPVPAGSNADNNVYVAKLDSNGNPSLELLARDAEGKVWGANCGARIGGIALSADKTRNKGSISADGTRVYFSARPSQPAVGTCNSASNKLRILKRVETQEGPWISQLISSECSRVANLPAVPACGTTGPSGTPVPDGDDVFQGASVDGSKVYFTTVRQLASTDLDGGSFNCELIGGFLSDDCDLYLYDSTRSIGQRLTQVSAGDGTDATPGANAEVLKVVAISGDGSHVYFIATDVLTTNPGPEGKVAQAGQSNLYLYERSAAHPDGRTAFVTTLTGGGTLSDAYPVPLAGKNSQGVDIGGDGHRLFFRSTAALTADDTDGARTDIFRYDAESEQLARISKGSLNDLDSGPFNTLVAESGFTFPTSPNYIVSGRWVSEDGGTVVFRTAEPLLPGDNNKAPDSYMWRGGAIHRLPGTGDVSGTLEDRPIVSMDGSSVAFQSYARLLPTDGDAAADVYVARVDGGFPPSMPPTPCKGEACQEPFRAQPGEESSGSAGFAGPGNPKSQPIGKCPKGKRKVRRAGKVHCGKPRKARHKAKQAQRNRDANTHRRAAK